ncbi:MAG: pilus assembly protein [Candidatus Omnitrophica bacterium]|nr:pilus assembly protein [Candidatus Omnitrophota bacterium]
MDDSARRIKDTDAQVTVELALVFVALILLLFGILKFWINFNENLVQRQPPYNASRVTAGSSDPGQWPVSTQQPLTESSVFGGK